MEVGTSAMHQVLDDIATRFDLERLSDSEFDRLFPESDDQRN